MSGIKIYRAGIHMGEEAVISGNDASGMITFSGCNLACSFCYTPETSFEKKGDFYSEKEFSALLGELVCRGARNINLITPTHLWRYLEKPLIDFKHNYARVPLVAKTGGYEHVLVLKRMAMLIDLFVPDFKCLFSESAQRVSLPANYGEVTLRGIEMLLKSHGQTAQSNVMGSEGRLTRGILVRHLMMPGGCEESLAIVKALAKVGYRSYFNIMTYFIEPVSKKIFNANPFDVSLVKKLAEEEGMIVLVNGRRIESHHGSSDVSTKRQSLCG